MTNDTKAPERIWASYIRTQDGMWIGKHAAQDAPYKGATGYIRHDLHLSLVAAAYEDMAKRHEVEAKFHADIGNTDRHLIYKQISKYTRTLTPDDAEAALEKVKREAEQRGYANAMEAERKLHEDRIEGLEKKLEKAVKAQRGDG